jgi:hypothetical protein
MPFVDSINDYSDGATGTLTDSNGDTVGYTVSGNSPTVNWQGLSGGARVNANGTQTFTVDFDQHVVGATIQISGSNSNEFYFIEVDGVTVDLNTLIANGDVTMTQSGAATHGIAADGSIFGGHHSDGSIAELVFNIPLTSFSISGTGGSSGNWDYFEVGIDNVEFDVVCFAQGTAITTETGSAIIETLKAGDLVRTADGTLKPIRWIGSRKISSALLKTHEKLRPVRITAGALGNELPKRDLLVSRQHRILVSSKVAERMFGVRDVLIPAIKLTALNGIFIDNDVQDIEYFHMLLDEHDVILAEGTPSESLLTGVQGLGALTPAAKEEILTLFPHLAHDIEAPKTARLVPTLKQQKRLISRHAQHGKPVLELFQPLH